MQSELLALIDAERRKSGLLAVEDSIAREYSEDRSECRIVYSRCGAGDLPGIIRNEIAMAEASPYTLEWKVYGHDTPDSLKAQLLAAGFEPEPIESVLILPINEETLAAFQGACIRD